jgi:hypoxanthine phosphoribosyltransferase
MAALNVKKVDGKRVVTTEILDSLDGKQVLLVEDMLETGRSLVEAKSYLERKGAVVTTTCLYTMPISELKPDFSLREVTEVVSFPWE